MRVKPAAPWQTQLAAKQGNVQEEKKTAKKQAGWPQGFTPFQSVLQKNPALKGLPVGIVTDINPAMQKEESRQKLGAVIGKMKMGQPLSEAEMSLLEKESPVLYQKAKFIKEERERYRKELEQCRSKEEVSELRQRKMTQFQIQAASINSSNMGAGEKQQAMEFVEIRMAGCENEYRDYVGTVQYQKLPQETPEKEKMLGPEAAASEVVSQHGSPVQGNESTETAGEEIVKEPSQQDTIVSEEECSGVLQPETIKQTAADAFKTMENDKRQETGNLISRKV